MVNYHISELRKQLHSKQKIIFGFIQAWNTHAATFFTSNFGRATNCFGRLHVDDMLATHERIQREIFAVGFMGGNDDCKDTRATSVVDHLKRVIAKRFGTSNIPDGCFFFPVEVGGLDLQSPFISLLQIRDSIIESPSNLLDEFDETERKPMPRLKLDLITATRSQNAMPLMILTGSPKVRMIAKTS
jgi:hypothetical protein